MPDNYEYHVCSCDDCITEPFEERCRYEESLRHLVAAIQLHRLERYGDPPRGPFYSTDMNLYRAAGIM